MSKELTLETTPRLQHSLSESESLQPTAFTRKGEK